MAEVLFPLKVKFFTLPQSEVLWVHVFLCKGRLEYTGLALTADLYVAS